MRRPALLIAALLLSGPALAGGQTTTNVPSAGTTAVSGFTCFSTAFCTAHVLIDNTGTEKATAGNPLRTDPTGTTPQPVTGTFFQATQPVSGTVSVSGTVTTSGSAVSQGSTTSGQTGPLIQAAVTTAVPSRTDGQTSPLSIDPVTAGIRIVAPTTQLLTSGSTAAGVDPGMGIGVLCQNGGAPTVSAAQTVSLQCNGTGQLITTAGNVAQGAALSGLTGPMFQALYKATPPTYSDSTVNPATTDIHGNLNVNVAAGSAANSAASATGSAVPANAGYNGVKIGANLVGQTGTTVSAVSAGDVNVALINGAVPSIGAGTEAAALRVTVANNSTGQIGISSASNGVTPLLSTTGGWTPFLLNQLGAAKVQVKGAGGQVGLLYCYNPNAVVTYIQFFDALSGSVTVGSTTPVQSYGIPPVQNGGAPIPVQGIQFNTGITVAATNAATNGAGPSTPVDCNVGYN